MVILPQITLTDMVPLLPRTTQHKFPDAEIAKSLPKQGTLS